MKVRLKKYYILSLCVLAGSVFAKSLSQGGVDLSTYHTVIYTNPIDWGPYYLNNAVSWILIYTAFNLSSGLPFGVSLSILDLILWCIFILSVKQSRDLKPYLAILALISFAGVLLSHNVLRQYVATIFVLIFSIRLPQKGLGKSSPFALLSILSHFSASVFIIGALMAKYKIENKLIRAMMYSALYVAGILFFKKYQPESISLAESIGDSKSEMYIYLSFSIIIFLIFLFKQLVFSKCFTDHELSGNIRRFMLYSLLLVFMIVVLNPPVWVANRFIVSFVFICSAYLYILSPTKIKGSGRVSLIIWDSVVFAIFALTIFLHPGAADMIKWKAL